MRSSHGPTRASGDGSGRGTRSAGFPTQSTGSWHGHAGGDIGFVAHGGVGTLLLCQYLGVPISRSLDQPFQGHYWVFDTGTREVIETWRPIAPR